MLAERYRVFELVLSTKQPSQSISASYRSNSGLSKQLASFFYDCYLSALLFRTSLYLRDTKRKASATNGVGVSIW